MAPESGPNDCEDRIFAACTPGATTEPFEQALSRKLDRLRAELLELHAHELRRACQDTAMSAWDGQSSELEGVLAVVDTTEFPTSLATGQTRTSDVGAPDVDSKCRQKPRLPTQNSLFGRNPSGFALSPVPTLSAGFALNEKWLSKAYVARHTVWPGSLISPGSIRHHNSSTSARSLLSESLSSMSGGFSLAWAFARLVMLWIDLLCVPLDLGFESISALSGSAFLLLGRCFWSLEVLVAVWKIRQQSLGTSMLQRWKTLGGEGALLINVAALTLEWFMLLLEPAGWQWWIGIGRTARLSLLMCAQARWATLTLDKRVSSALPASFARLPHVPQRCFYTAVGAHWAICLWSRGVGYAADMAWRFQAADRLSAVDACLSLLAALLITCVLFAQTTSQVLLLEKSSRAQLQQMINAFVGRQTLSLRLAERIQQSQLLSARGAVAQRFREEEEMMKHFPETLRLDLLAEVRGRMLTRMQFFADLKRGSYGIIRDLACEAIVPRLALEGDVVFSTGAAARHMYFVDAGSLCYRVDAHWHPEAGPPDWRDSSGAVTIPRKAWISEVAVWTTWQHAGECAAPEDSIVLALSGDQLFDVLSKCPTALWHTIKYAKRFVWALNCAVENENDAVVDDTFTCPTQLLDLVGESPASVGGHFAFISHYKEEAGTEATLMQAELQQLMQMEPLHPANDMHCPVFLDSENLTNLDFLTEHVRMSCNLILLLTPDVLRRPWCLLEIVTAFNNSVNVVLVRVERPGYTFEYPDDDFYATLVQGGFLGQEAEDILNSKGVSLSDLEVILRQVFMQIAVPFSPHRTLAVRQVELAEVLKRCTGSEMQDAAAGR